MFTISYAMYMFKTVIQKLSKIGIGTVTHKYVISPEDLQKMNSHDTFSCHT